MISLMDIMTAQPTREKYMEATVKIKRDMVE